MLDARTGILSRKLVREEVYDRLFEAIVGGDLLPDEQVLDQDVIAWLGVSRTPIREAFHRLEGMGLVDITPQRETRVTLIDPTDLQQRFDALGALLAGVVRDAVPLLTDADVRALSQLHADNIDGQHSPRRERARALTEGVLGVFVQRLDNQLLAGIVSRYLPAVTRALTVAPTAVPPEKAGGILGGVVEAAGSGDPAQAAAAVAAYWETGLGTVVDELAAQDGEAA
jgi:DNA-binding GntR family transcriptional regulator